MEKRTYDFHIRMNEKEMSALNEMVRRAGMSREKFVRKIIAGSKVYEAPPVDFFNLLREVSRLGSNIEQILKRANVSGYVDTSRLVKSIDELDAIETRMWDAFAPDGR